MSFVRPSRLRELLRGFRNALYFTNRFQILWERIFRRQIPLTHYIWKNRFYILCSPAQGDHVAIQECLCDRAYDPLLAECLFPAGQITYVNVGANIGGFDLALAERGLAIAAGLAVELNPFTALRCRINLQTNHFSTTQVVNAGVAGSDGQMTFHPLGHSFADSIFTAPEAGHGAATPVELLTLKTLLAKHAGHFQRFDLLKLDCEQAEYVILKTTPPEVLQKFQHIIIEFHPAPAGESEIEAEAKLVAAGFRPVLRLPNIHCPGFTALFVRL